MNFVKKVNFSFRKYNWKLKNCANKGNKKVILEFRIKSIKDIRIDIGRKEN